MKWEKKYWMNELNIQSILIKLKGRAIDVSTFCKLYLISE